MLSVIPLKPHDVEPCGSFTRRAVVIDYDRYDRLVWRDRHAEPAWSRCVWMSRAFAEFDTMNQLIECTEISPRVPRGQTGNHDANFHL